MLHGGLSAKATPTRLEAFLARNTRHLAIPGNARLTQNPVLDSPEGQREARLHFADHCAICHGNNGSGDTPIGNGLYPKPPDLRKPQTQELSDGELFWIIENGVRFTGMPAFSSNGNHISANHGNGQDSWKLVHFIRHLPSIEPGEWLQQKSRHGGERPRACVAPQVDQPQPARHEEDAGLIPDLETGLFDAKTGDPYPINDNLSIHEVNIQKEIKRHWREISAYVISVLLDTYEQQVDESVRVEIHAALDALLLHLLSSNALGAVSHLLREVAVGGRPSRGDVSLVVGLVGHRERHDVGRA